MAQTLDQRSFASGLALDELREALGEAIGLHLWDRPARLGDLALSVGEIQVGVERPKGV